MTLSLNKLTKGIGDWHVPINNNFQRIMDFAANFDEQILAGTGKRYATIVIGHKNSGHTANEVDFLCTGTDDQIVINNAIAALSSVGGKIVIREGIYNLTDRISVNKDNVTIEGVGFATTLSRRYNESIEGGVIHITGSFNIIKNLRIIGNKDSYPKPENAGIYFKDGSCNSAIGNICENNSFGICFTDGISSVITNNRCISNGDGIRLSYAMRINITNNICRDNDYGLYAANTSNSAITSNVFTRDSYDDTQYTMQFFNLKDSLVALNNIKGKDYFILSGTGNTFAHNKYKETDDNDQTAVIGELSSLLTDDKKDIVSAINELSNKINALTNNIIINGGNSVG